MKKLVFSVLVVLAGTTLFAQDGAKKEAVKADKEAVKTDKEAVKKESQRKLESKKSEFLNTLPKNTEPILYADTVCSLCRSKDQLITKGDIESNHFFTRCRQSTVKLYSIASPKKCGPCSFINELAQIFFKRFGLNMLTVCLKCCMNTLVDDLKHLYCSSCLRGDSFSSKKTNIYCAQHKSCNKCASVPAKLAPVNCYFCIFFEFYAHLVEVNMTTNDLAANHHKLNCAKDFCELNFDAEAASKIVRLACGHATCRISASNNLCSYCLISKILGLLKNKHNILTDEIMYAKIEDDVKKAIELQNKSSFNSYYDKVQTKLNHIEKSNATEDLMTDDEDDSCDKDHDDAKSQNETEDEVEDEVDDEIEDEIEDEEEEETESSGQVAEIFTNDHSLEEAMEGGTILIRRLDEHLPGYDCNTIQINIFISNGIQKVNQDTYRKFTIFIPGRLRKC